MNIHAYTPTCIVVYRRCRHTLKGVVCYRYNHCFLSGDDFRTGTTQDAGSHSAASAAVSFASLSLSLRSLVLIWCNCCAESETRVHPSAPSATIGAFLRRLYVYVTDSIVLQNNSTPRTYSRSL